MSTDSTDSLSTLGHQARLTMRGVAIAIAALLLSVLAPPQAEAAGSTCFGHAATVVSNAAVVHGTSGNDVIVGGSANQKIYAGGGNDIVCAGGGNDRIYGQGGDDVLHGQAGNDVIQPGHGNDEVTAGSGNDRVLGTSGVNDIHMGSGHDSVESINPSDTDDTIRATEVKKWTDGVATEDLGYGGKRTTFSPPLPGLPGRPPIVASETWSDSPNSVKLYYADGTSEWRQFDPLRWSVRW